MVQLPLPDTGDVTIGRGREVDARIDAPSISRRHALLRLSADGSISIEDLGSANGTRVRGNVLARGMSQPLKLGEVADLGSVLVSVQRHHAEARPRRVWSHAFFEAHLEEACLRAAHAGDGATLAVLAIRGGGDAPSTSRVLRPADVIGLYAADEYEVILVDVDAVQATELAARIRAELGKTASVGVASYPRDGRAPDALLAAARGGLGDAPVRLESGNAMRDLRRLVERIAPGTISVLVLGETGVGKEVVAESIHKASKRAAKPYLKLNCAALSDTLLESELFGHEKGSFTGAVGTKPGLLETADGGTVFLDELGEMPMPIQVKLLRVIEDRAVLRVGGLKPKSIDVRFVGATNRDLEAEIAKGTFRQDLYFRLNGISLVIPPLRERVDEIAGLARAFIASSWQKLERDDEVEPRLSAETLALLESYAWPGNIRELRNILERAALLCSDGVITPEHLPAERMRAQPATSYPAGAGYDLGAPVARPVASPASSEPPRRVSRVSTPAPKRPEAAPPMKGTLPQNIKREIEALEKQRIIDALTECAGNQTHAARLLGISRATLVSRLDVYGIKRPRKPRG